MSEPIKYLKIVSDVLSLYQKELLRLFKKYPLEQHVQFKKIFLMTYNQMKETQLAKSIEDGVSSICEGMFNYLQQPFRANKTSLEHRKSLKSQGGNRIFRMTGGFKKQNYENEEPIEEEQQIHDIIHSYKIQDDIMPKMRMKWKSAYEPERQTANRQTSIIGNNNIDLLSYTIPQIENSIRRLSMQRSPKTVKERQLDVYRTLESRSMKKKYIPRLF